MATWLASLILRAGRPPDSPRGVGRLVATAAAVAQAPKRDPPAGIGVPFRPRRASSNPPCGGRPGQDYVLDRATTPPETSSRPRRRLRPHPRPHRRASTTSEAIRDKPTVPGTRSTTTGPPPGRRRPPSEGGGGVCDAPPSTSLSHLHGNQNCQQFACIFRCCRFIVAH